MTFSLGEADADIVQGATTPQFFFTLRLFQLVYIRENSKSDFNNAVLYTVQSTLVISISKGLSEVLRDIRTSTYQVRRIKEK